MSYLDSIDDVIEDYRQGRRAQRVKGWLIQQDVYDGVKDVEYSEHHDQVMVRLEEPVDLEIYEDVMEENYETKWWGDAPESLVIRKGEDRKEHVSRDQTYHLKMWSENPVSMTLTGIKPTTEEDEIRLETVKKYLSRLE